MDARQCFDVLRDGFFIRGRGAASDAQQAVVRLIFEIAGECPASQVELQQFANALPSDSHETELVA